MESKQEHGTGFPLRPLRWVAVAALGVSLFMSALDATIVALALPSISHSFQLSDGAAALVFLSYSVPLTLLVLPSGGVVKRFSALPTFAVSVLGFGLGSLVCGLAPSLVVLLAGRVIQGSFAAFISTQGFAIAGAIVSANERGKAMGVLGTIAPLGGVAGPGLGGLLLSTFGWQSIFYANLPVCLLAAGLGVLSLRGFMLPSWGAAKASVYSQMMGLMRRTAFLASVLGFFFSVTMSVALYYVLPFDFGTIQGLSPELAGGVLLLVPLGMMAMGMAGGFLTDRYGPKAFMLVGAGLILLGAFSVSFAAPSRTPELDFAWRLLVLGSGIGLFSSPTSTAIMSFGGREAMAAASTVTNLAARLGTVAGPMLIGLVWASVGGFSAQIENGVLLVDGLALSTLLAAVFSGRWQSAAPLH